uniref:Uncharacterized protein n=2 Tax=Chromera velia CCMP2878 TaxID=1169474 RepID=A0A0K6S8I6_9ALVE|eukprot:Cvel_25244.t1-p1 / transcript=Cvel_25244.t1 / gene=Cvel_25244 / organism=Chromera_velia_CCMP2878 / gene_product=hypothetical protein / transcript_product=hypothetical protein / location=Cvel_scaffold2832:14166-15377(-) / protein_length=404 / sequence_SO=supercontig / SO=protein_coding / is_pseudo=false
MSWLSHLKVALAASVAVLIIWKPTIVVLFPGLIYTSDLGSVFLHDGCVGASALTIYIFCAMEVLIAALLLKVYVVPAMFRSTGNHWDSFDGLKQRKLIGNVVKIIVRASCGVQIACLVGPYICLEKGLFADFNMKQAYARFVQERTVTTCEEAGMILSDAVAMRAWIFARDSLMSVMVWELAFIPDLPTDAWLHHVFVIFATTFAVDPQFMAGPGGKATAVIDNIAFSLVLGACLAACVEACVLMYQLNVGSPEVQARWMLGSIGVQSLLVLGLFLGFPILMLGIHWDNFKSGIGYGIIALLVFLGGVEVHMVTVKWAIVKKAREKARRLRDGTAASADLVAGAEGGESLACDEGGSLAEGGLSAQGEGGLVTPVRGVHGGSGTRVVEAAGVDARRLLSKESGK